MTGAPEAGEPVLRPAAPGERGAILALLRRGLGEGSVPRTEAFWRWKHESSPFGPSPVLVAESAGGIVGVRAFLRWELRTGDRRVACVRAVDTVTHPDHRNRGIFTALTLRLAEAMAEEGVALVFNTPNERSRPGYRKMGWSVVGRPTLWARPTRPLRLARSLLGGGRGGAGAADPPPVDAPSAREALDAPGLADLLEAARPRDERRLHTPVDAAYLRWRYAEIPEIVYRVASAGTGADAALLVVRTRRRGGRVELRVCEALAGPGGEARRNLRRLLRGIPRGADADVAVASAMGRPALARDLLGSGFAPIPRAGPTLTARPLAERRPGGIDPLELASWRASIGDLEIF